MRAPLHRELVSRLIAIGLFACTACAPRGSGARPPARVSTTDRAGEPTAMVDKRSAPAPGDDPERGRKIAEYLAPGRGETAAQGSLPPGLDQPMSKDATSLLERCDAQREKVFAKAKTLTDDESVRRLFAKELRTLDPRCAELANQRNVRELETIRDAALQKRIVMLADAIAQAPSSCKKGDDNPKRPKPEPPSCPTYAPLSWDAPGWSCLAAHLPAEQQKELNVEGSHWSWSIDADLGTYEVVVSSCYHPRADTERAWTELVVRGRLGEKPQPTHFFRRAAVTD